jgi:hypothetical protein
MNPHTILLLGEYVYDEAIAAAAIRPGDLIERTSANKVQKHSAAGGNAEVTFAYEDALQGKGISDNYAAGDLCFFATIERGGHAYAWLSGGEAAVVGSKLSSNGDGALKVESSTGKVVAIALEAIDASESDDVDHRIRVQLV